MKEEVLLFAERFVEGMKREKKAFAMSDIEKSYNLEREKNGKPAVKLTNMERLTLVSRLLRKQLLQRTYKKTTDPKCCQVLFF
ncbi:hypothetical protein [Enterococcus sp. DIV1420a]|uniref:hypothetical protein n=1 Tax=Enterococcus sp. DIV1420a TaxID=2774672 RepID=UPI003F25C6FE